MILVAAAVPEATPPERARRRPYERAAGYSGSLRIRHTDLAFTTPGDVVAERAGTCTGRPRSGVGPACLVPAGLEHLGVEREHRRLRLC